MKKIWMVLGCMALLVTGCGDQQADRDYRNGMQALEKEEYDAAIEDFEAVIARNRRLSEAYRGSGIAWLARESYPEAIAAFSRSLNYMDASDKEFEKDVMYYLAQARKDYGEKDKAIQIYSDILKKETDPQAFFLRGELYIEQGDMEKAGRDFERALDGCRDYDLYINIYQRYLDENKIVDGNSYLEKALEIMPETGEDYYHRGRIYVYQESYEKAKETLLTSMQKGYGDAMLLLGDVYLRTDDPASARAMYQEYLQKSEHGAKAYNGLAICDIYEKNYDSALQHIRSGLELNDEDANQGLLYNEIAVYEYKKEFVTAREKMKAYLERYPDDEDGLRENEFLSTR